MESEEIEKVVENEYLTWKYIFRPQFKDNYKAESSDLKGYDLIKLLNPFVLWIINERILVQCWWWCLSTNKD